MHVSAFPRDGQRPALGESLSFEVETDAAGKKRAVGVERPLRAGAVSSRPRWPAQRREGSGLLGGLLKLGVIAAIAYVAYGQYEQRAARHAAYASDATYEQASTSTPSNFHCDGRQHCSEMTSCAEAKMFLENCPGMKMDGDHDRIPCEDTLCRTPRSD